MKKFYPITIGILILFLFASKLFAAPLTQEGKTTNKSAQAQIRTSAKEILQEKRASKEATIKDKALDNLKTKAIKQIDNRIEALNKIITRIDKDKKISNTTKTTLKTDINGQISKLEELKTKISQNTDAAAIREDYKKVLNEKIYAFYIHKMRLLVITEHLLATEAKLEELSERIQGLLTNLTSEGKDVKSAQLALDDINTRLSDIKNILEADRTKLALAVPADGNKVFTEVRQDYAKVRANFAKIRADIAQMRGKLKIVKNIIKPSGTSTPSATITPSSTPSATTAP